MSDKKTKYDRRYLKAVDAAASVFAEKGFHGASTMDIANKLDIKQGSLYYYFRSKEAALEAVCLEGINYQIEQLENIVASQCSFPEAVGKIIHTTVMSLEERADYLIVFNNERQTIPLERRGNIRELSSSYHKQLDTFFLNAQKHGDLRPDLDITITVRVLTGLLSSVYSWYQNQQEIDLEKVSKQYTSLFLTGSLQPEEVLANA